MNWDVGTISVISSAVIAALSLLLPPLFSLFQDHFKWKREAKAAEAQKIDKATIELLECLAPYRSGETNTATGRPPAEVYSKLLSKYYAWENTIWLNCKKVEHARLKELRGKFEEHRQTLHKLGPSLADEILELSHIASGKL